MKARTAVLFSILFVALFAVSASAQPVGWSVSEPQPLSELELPFVSDEYFVGNNSPGNAVLYIDGKRTEPVIVIPPFSFRWVYFYVTSETKVELRVNVVTNKGLKVQKMKRRRARTSDGLHWGWLFELK